MAQPKEPPISYRPGKARGERIKAYAVKHRLHGADVLHSLIDIALETEEPSPSRKSAIRPKPVPSRDAPSRASVSRIEMQVGPVQHKAGERFKAKWNIKS